MRHVFLELCIMNKNSLRILSATEVIHKTNNNAINNNNNYKAV